MQGWTTHLGGRLDFPACDGRERPQGSCRSVAELGDVLGDEAIIQIAPLQLLGERAESSDLFATGPTSAVAAHRPNVIVSQDRRVIDDDLLPGSDRPRREEKELIVDLANAGVRLAGMIQVAPERLSGIEIRLRPESKAVVGEPAASIPEESGVDDAADDLDDRLMAPIRVRGEQAEAVAGGADVGRRNGGMVVERFVISPKPPGRR